ncbi:hypothetical protein [Radiobacillus sp. PE A8.2]|uniref:hypothetical protein n=1 Tax=Radiobacillus sp. PE A8.2 TaxID=3380349 RepID=UPI00389116B5
MRDPETFEFDRDQEWQDYQAETGTDDSDRGNWEDQKDVEEYGPTKEDLDTGDENW